MPKHPSLHARSATLNLALPTIPALLLANATGWPFFPLYWLLTANGWLFALMYRDKQQARAHPHRPGQATPEFAGRTPESTLLLLTLLGATPAMFAARHLLRHKTTKAGFVQATYGIAIAQVALMGYFHAELLNWAASLLRMQP